MRCTARAHGAYTEMAARALKSGRYPSGVGSGSFCTTGVSDGGTGATTRSSSSRNAARGVKFRNPLSAQMTKAAQVNFEGIQWAIFRAAMGPHKPGGARKQLCQAAIEEYSLRRSRHPPALRMPRSLLGNLRAPPDIRIPARRFPTGSLQNSPGASVSSFAPTRVPET